MANKEQEVIEAKKVELTQSQKNKIMDYNKTVVAAQAAMNAYITGIGDGLNVPMDYGFDGQGLCFVQQPKKD